MEVMNTGIEGVLLLQPKVWRDPRGYFLETWQAERYAAIGINATFVQDNHSRSGRDVLRGLHFQRKRPQGKLVSVSLGSVFDVAVDIRPASPTFGQWVGVELSEENQRQLWIPPGFAHGFCVTSPQAGLHYKCTEFYHAEDEASIRWDDPDIAIQWPIDVPVLSQKDKISPSLKDLSRLSTLHEYSRNKIILLD